jgi:hypothetical protein
VRLFFLKNLSELKMGIVLNLPPKIKNNIKHEKNEKNEKYMLLYSRQKKCFVFLKN